MVTPPVIPPQLCPHCHGVGTVPMTMHERGKEYAFRGTCPICHGHKTIPAGSYVMAFRLGVSL